MSGHLTEAELARHLSHAECAQIAALTRVLRLGGTAEFLGVSRSTLDTMMGWRRVRRDVLVRVRAILATAVPMSTRQAGSA